MYTETLRFVFFREPFVLSLITQVSEKNVNEVIDNLNKKRGIIIACHGNEV